MLKDSLEYCLLNSTKLLEFKKKLFPDQPFTNNTLSSLLSLQKIFKFNIKIKNLFTELLLLSTMLPLPTLLLKERPTIEPSKFQFSMMLELKYLLFTTFLNITMFLSILKCHLLRTSSKETLKTSTSILKITLEKQKKVKKMKKRVLALTVEDQVVIDAETDTLLEWLEMLISVDFLTDFKLICEFHRCT